MYKVPAFILIAALGGFLGPHALDARVAAQGIRGIELVAAVNLIKEDVNAEGRLFLPAAVGRARTVIVVTSWGLGLDVYADPEIRKVAEMTESGLLLSRVTSISTTGIDNAPVLGRAGEDALLTVLQQLAHDSGHGELASTPLLFWGHSRAGNFGAAFAASHPERTAAFVLYQSAAAQAVQTGSVMKALSQVPALIIEGIVAPQFDSHAAENLWSRGRSLGAAWAFVHQTDAPHGSDEHRKQANDLMVSWMAAVIQQRVSQDGRLAAVSGESSWLGNNQNGDIVTFVSSPDWKPRASWLPDERSARAWRDLLRVKR
jgi:pimeloyl-ACP methyl ester carboxylesterase